jgi:hypothetical protein
MPFQAGRKIFIEQQAHCGALLCQALFPSTHRCEPASSCAAYA